jgi:ribosomal protein S18 acetylase RimI-like enzyme
MDYSIRLGGYEDLGAVLQLWEAADAEPTRTDDLDSLAALMERDPRSLLVAEVDGTLAGTVIAGWDGWRGSIYRLAVLPAYRRSGLGSRLVAEAEQHLQRQGARRLQANVVETDDRAMGFWHASEWQEQDERRRFVLG